MIISIIVMFFLFMLKAISSLLDLFFEAIAPLIVLIIIFAGGGIARFAVIIHLALFELIGIGVFVVVVFLYH